MSLDIEFILLPTPFNVKLQATRETLVISIFKPLDDISQLQLTQRVKQIIVTQSEFTANATDAQLSNIKRMITTIARQRRVKVTLPAEFGRVIEGEHEGVTEIKNYTIETALTVAIGGLILTS